jgi:hypothetical protein
MERNNVLCRIKEDLNRGVTGLVCVAHMIHNCAHSSINIIPQDIQGLVVTIFGYFHIFTVRVKRLKEFSIKIYWATVMLGGYHCYQL